jgi:hypothetical protein
MEPEKEDFMTSKWRPMMAIMYMCVCACDFIIFPIMFTVVQFWEVTAANDAFRQWMPITLQGAGLFHMAMGAVLGITAWSRGQEKIAGVASPPVGASSQISTTQVTTSQATTTVSASIEDIAPPVRTGYGGKIAPPPNPQFPI